MTTTPLPTPDRDPDQEAEAEAIAVGLFLLEAPLFPDPRRQWPHLDPARRALFMARARFVLSAAADHRQEAPGAIDHA